MDQQNAVKCECVRFPLAALLALCGLACGGSAAGPADAGTVVNCATDARVATYVDGIAMTTTSGTLNFQLVHSMPGPPARGTDTWTVRVTDGAGQPQTGLTFTALPFMPDHGHGTSVDPTVTGVGDGKYTVTPLYFFMPGVWRTTITSTTPAASAAIFFCIPG